MSLGYSSSIRRLASSVCFLFKIRCLVVCSAASCPEPYSPTAIGCLYVQATQNYNWCSANQQCTSMDGRLVSTPSTVLSLTTVPDVIACNCNLWLGLTDLSNERGNSSSGWRTVAPGNPVFPDDRSKWYTNEPSGMPGENCVRAMPGSILKLTDISCASLYGFVCEYVGASAASTITWWQQAAFDMRIYNGFYCQAEVTEAPTVLECMSRATRMVSVKSLLYNGKLRRCVLLLYIDARVYRVMENSADWAKIVLRGGL